MNASDARALALLKSANADKLNHSGETLYDHLYGVYKVLVEWGCPQRVCLAGLFHSVYGTTFFKQNIFTDVQRPLVQNVIGTDAERLAWIFCKLRRSSLYTALTSDVSNLFVRGGDGTIIPVSRQEVIDLMVILWANALEQDRRRSYTRNARDQQAFLDAKDVLPNKALVELRNFYLPSPIKTLLGESAALFERDTWPDEVLLSTGPIERLAGLADYSFDDLVEMPRSFAKAFRVENGVTHTNMIAQGHERRFYDEGWTVYWHSLKAPRMDEWVRALDAELGLVVGATRVSAFASKRGPGLRTHYDLNDNIVCQASGKKNWRIGAPTVRYPTVGYTLGDTPNEAQAAELDGTEPPKLDDAMEMCPGDVLFMPRGYWHDTETTSDESLHFNIQCGLATWKDLIEYLVLDTRLFQQEAFRAPIRRLGPEALNELPEKLHMLALDNVNVAELCRFVAKRRSA